MKLASKILFFSLLVSCGTDPVEIPRGAYEKGVLVINEGAFGANDGEIYHYDTETGEVESSIFEKTNARPFAGLIQNMRSFGAYHYLVANTGKVEIVRSSDFMSVGAVEGELLNSRSLVASGEKLFISDWGAYDEAWNNPDSFIAVVNDLEGGSIANKIDIASRPEGLIISGNRILVACQQDQVISVLNPENETVEKTVPVSGTPFYFFEYANHTYLYANDAENVYVHQIDPVTFEVDETHTFGVANSIYNGNFAHSGGGELFVISNQANEDVVIKLSLSTGTVVEERFYSGNNFYGLGYDEATQTLFIGEHAGWQGNGSVLRVNSAGELIDQLPVGRGPSGFYFP
ncbi:YncE family protein [Cyclobacterium jeungdonense]|uniref:Surface layer protein n=1 Tax=Cyclobacterium jeungdonense TaxID=708087 RepID=A0ABT8CB11_9BACT|nr:surface layer protein [Cyclobacterium jeungdonense]MDN3688798.1 surface layer protein [Cyclobacterium jeungdonense]